MTPKPPEEQSSDTAGVVNLWSVKNIYDCNFWFLGVEQAMEITESYKEPDERNRGESFNAEVKVPGHVTTLTTVRRPRPHSSGLVWSAVLRWSRSRWSPVWVIRRFLCCWLSPRLLELPRTGRLCWRWKPTWLWRWVTPEVHKYFNWTQTSTRIKNLIKRTFKHVCPQLKILFSNTQYKILWRSNPALYLQVNYFNEIQAVWEPLIERVDGGSRRWKLELEVDPTPCIEHITVTNMKSFIQMSWFVGVDEEQPSTRQDSSSRWRVCDSAWTQNSHQHLLHRHHEHHRVEVLP